VTAFSTLNVLPAAQLDNLNELGYLTMTPVQAAALPAILEGRDVRVQAKTGSGKTAAFGLGLLQHIDAALSDPVSGAVSDPRAGRPGCG
jgi:ATP-independent RNA helicase DbpA